MSFLNVLIKKTEHLSTSVFRKQTDTLLYLSSFHPPGLKKAYSHLLRESPVLIMYVFEDLCNCFRDRGYNDHVVGDSLDKATNGDRNCFLTPKPPSKKDSKLVLATTFSPLSTHIKRFVTKYWHILSIEPLVGHSFKEFCKQMCQESLRHFGQG